MMMVVGQSSRKKSKRIIITISIVKNKVLHCWSCINTSVLYDHDKNELCCERA